MTDQKAEPDKGVSPGAAVPEDIARLAWFLDQQFEVPIIGRRIGADGLIGLIPGVGDSLSLGLAGYIILRAHRLGAPVSLLTKMVGHSALDWFLGLMPFFGDLVDFAYQSNRKNVQLLSEWLQTLDAQEFDPLAKN